MKKFFGTILFSIWMISLSIITVMADTAVTISDDYQTVKMDGMTYQRYNTSEIESAYNYIDEKISLTPEQKEQIEDTELYVNDENTSLRVIIYFTDGASMSINYLREDYINAYQDYESNAMERYVINFSIKDNNQLTVTKEQLFAKSVTLNNFLSDWYAFYSVSGLSNKDSIPIRTGVLLLTYDDIYYYIDFKENEIKGYYDFYPDNYSILQAYEITDPELKSAIMDADNSSPIFGDVFEDETEKITVIAGFLYIAVCSLLFIILPVILIILTIILNKNASKAYKRIYRVIRILSILEIGPAVFILLKVFGA